MRDAASLRDMFTGYSAESFLHIIGLRLCSRSRTNSSSSSGCHSSDSGTRTVGTSTIDGPHSETLSPRSVHQRDSLDAAAFAPASDRDVRGESGECGDFAGQYGSVVLEEPCDPADCEIHSAHTLHVVIARNGAITALCSHQRHLFVSCSQTLWTYSLGKNLEGGGPDLADGSMLRNLPTPSGVKVLQPFVAMAVDTVANVLVATDSVHGVTLFRCAAVQPLLQGANIPLRTG